MGPRVSNKWFFSDLWGLNVILASFGSFLNNLIPKPTFLSTPTCPSNYTFTWSKPSKQFLCDCPVTYFGGYLNHAGGGRGQWWYLKHAAGRGPWNLVFDWQCTTGVGLNVFIGKCLLIMADHCPQAEWKSPWPSCYSFAAWIPLCFRNSIRSEIEQPTSM